MKKFPNVSLLSFANCDVLDQNGDKIRVSSIWKNKTTVFVFIRHFGCVTCRGIAEQIWNDRHQYQSAGAQIVFIGNGSPTYIEYFKEDLHITEATVYTDPSLESFRALGFRRGFLVSLGLKSLVNGVKMLKQGYSQGKYKKESGDLWQLGGVLVVKPNGVVTYHYISEALGDYGPAHDVVEGID